MNSGHPGPRPAGAPASPARAFLLLQKCANPGRLRPHSDFINAHTDPTGPSVRWRRGRDELGPSWPSPCGRSGFACACIFAPAKMCEPWEASSTLRLHQRTHGPYGSVCTLAEREGFEPSMGVTPYTLSRRAPSASRTPLRWCDCASPLISDRTHGACVRRV